MPHACVGIKKTGHRCTVMVMQAGLRCGKHDLSKSLNGPNTQRRNELAYVHNKNLQAIWRALRDEGGNAINAARRAEDIRHEQDLLALNMLIHAEIEANGGVDPDDAIIAARRERQIQRRELAQARWEENRAFNAEIRNRLLQVNAAVQNAAARPVGALANLANDRQNVHTELVVAKVREAVATILRIAVPAEYETETLKTSGEIIMECKLSKRAAWQMMSKYCADDEIYGLGEGIYARVLNSIWQYIKASPDSSDLKKILASEMEDNIGMCAQGNLSRLCNILSGYIDGINAEVKSRNQIIGELLAPLMEIQNVHERLKQAIHILRTHNVHDPDERDAWLEPLGDDEDDIPHLVLDQAELAAVAQVPAA